MFRQLRVHTPAPLTPDSQRVANQTHKMFALSLTPAAGRGSQAGSRLESGTVTRSTTAVGTMPPMPHLRRADSHDSATSYDLRQCARCGEQNQYCHSHTPVIPNPTLNLPPQLPVQAPIPANSVAQFNLSRVQATAQAGHLVNALEKNGQDTIEVPPPYDYGLEFTNIIAEGLGIPPTVTAEGLGVRSGRHQRQNRG
jgi:hypothetical protein